MTPTPLYLVALFAAASLLSGCALLRSDSQRGYETISAEVEADTEMAAKKNHQAIKAIHKDNWAAARKDIDLALIADVNHAPSHNTLGQIYYQEKNLYLAAWEYEFAIRLSPSVPEYHNNLGLVYEAADRLKDAEQQYSEAIVLEPQNYHFVSNYAKIRIRQGELNPETRRLLEEVVYLDPRPEWKDWAQQQLTQSHLNVPSDDVISTSYPETPSGFSELPSAPVMEFESIEQ